MGRKRKPLGFDELDGKPYYEYLFNCPRRKFWRIGHAAMAVIPPHYYDTYGQD